MCCLLYTPDAADDPPRVALSGRRNIQQKTPTPYHMAKAEDAQASCEDLGVAHLEESDLDEANPAVDIDAESSELSGNTTESASDSSTDNEAAQEIATHRRQAYHRRHSASHMRHSARHRRKAGQLGQVRHNFVW